MKEVAKTLGVAYVLEGSVRKAGNRVRITAQLIDGAAGDHVWADRYDRDLEDIFAPLLVDLNRREGDEQGGGADAAGVVRQDLPEAEPERRGLFDFRLFFAPRPRQPGLLGIQPGGRVNLPGIPLRLIMSLAWNSNTNDEIIGLPKWAESAAFDIVGKVPAEYAPTTGNGSIQDIAPMLQSLRPRSTGCKRWRASSK